VKKAVLILEDNDERIASFEKTVMALESRMAENGVIFSDGFEKDFWNSIPRRRRRLGLRSGRGCWWK
jgi:hypothetical protein